MMTHLEFSLPQLSNWHKKIYLNYAKQVLESQQLMMTKKDKSILHYTLKRNDVLNE